MYMIFSKVLKHLAMWPIAYPKPAAINARVSPLNFKLLAFTIVLKLKDKFYISCPARLGE